MREREREKHDETRDVFKAMSSLSWELRTVKRWNVKSDEAQNSPVQICMRSVQRT